MAEPLAAPAGSPHPDAGPELGCPAPRRRGTWRRGLAAGALTVLVACGGQASPTAHRAPDHLDQKVWNSYCTHEADLVRTIGELQRGADRPADISSQLAAVGRRLHTDAVNARRTDTTTANAIRGIADAAGQLASANRDGVDTIRPLARLLEATLTLPNC